MRQNNQETRTELDRTSRSETSTANVGERGYLDRVIPLYKKKKQKKNETEHDDGWAEEKDTLQCRWKKRTDLRAEKIINDFKEDYETVRQN